MTSAPYQISNSRIDIGHWKYTIADAIEMWALVHIAWANEIAKVQLRSAPFLLNQFAVLHTFPLYLVFRVQKNNKKHKQQQGSNPAIEHRTRKNSE